ncbi:MAG: 16S rRNA (guanine(966)-N(2))-methyltransferase RsmD [Clostridia bacterium]|nr:16S rRNA (guanine(966)-N(2))-methyltransferase RsmD [Clostridia bacterium]
MRVIAGSAKGRRLFSPDGMDTRPTTDRVRESLFSILAGRVTDARVLDLFAGSGALSIEALSRGAQSAVINDFSRQAVRCIERNVNLTGFSDACVIMCRDWKSALERLRGHKFSLVFFDPPYSRLDYYTNACEALARLDLLDEDATIVMERRSKDAIEIPDDFLLRDERRYGDTTIAFVTRRVSGE